MRAVCGLQSPPGSPLQFLAHPWNSHLPGHPRPQLCKPAPSPPPCVCSLSFPRGTLTDLLLEASFKEIPSLPVFLTVPMDSPLPVKAHGTDMRCSPGPCGFSPLFKLVFRGFCLFGLHHKTCKLLKSSSPSRDRTCASCIRRQICTTWPPLKSSPLP